MTIPTVLNNDYKDFEVVVSDNLSDDQTLEYLHKLQDMRLRIVYPDIRLSMSEHYEFALSNARGEWVNLLGADDVLLPTIFRDMDTITKKHPIIEVVNWTRSYFFWPGVEEIYGNTRISYTEYGRKSRTSSKAELVRGFLGLKQILDLPQLYTCSFISSELIERIKKKGDGKFYVRSIPDIYSSIEILQNSKWFLRICRPLTLVGSSNSSLGIGNRIYKDSLDNSASRMSLLNPKINFDLHQQKISAYYLLDAYLNFSDKHQQLPRKTYLLMAQIGVESELLRRGMLKKEIQNFRIGAELLNFGRGL
jgi:glycosyltransferase involved in cell wall biosynthesis